MERLVCKEILQNAEIQGLLSDRQYVFRQERSTTDGLLRFSNFVANSMNEGDPVDVIYTDFKNAFETMPHDLLLSVLPMRGVGSKVTAWVSDSLRGRSFRVKIRDALSRVGYATTDCPQGTLQGSTLFLLFVDQLKHVVPERVKVFTYADDVKLAMRVRDQADRVFFQSVLDDFTTWAAHSDGSEALNAQMFRNALWRAEPEIRLRIGRRQRYASFFHEGSWRHFFGQAGFRKPCFRCHQESIVSIVLDPAIVCSEGTVRLFEAV